MPKAKPKARPVKRPQLKMKSTTENLRPLVDSLQKNLDASIVNYNRLTSEKQAIYEQMLEATKSADNKVDEIYRLNSTLEIIAKVNEGLTGKIKALEDIVEKQTEALLDAARMIDAKTEYLKKLAQNNFGIAKRANGEIVLINAPEFTDFMAVQMTKSLSLYEAAMQIFDVEMLTKATDAIGKANTERNEVALLKMKDRVIHILQTQKKGPTDGI